jgi:hemerythrin
VGVARFDRDHQQAVQLLQQIQGVLIRDRDRARAHHLMEQLFQQTRLHFAEEESALKESGYPDLDSHLAEHERLLAETAGLLKQFNLHTISDLAFPNFVAQWLIEHITGADQTYARWLRRSSPAPARAALAVMLDSPGSR